MNVEITNLSLAASRSTRVKCGTQDVNIPVSAFSDGWSCVPDLQDSKLSAWSMVAAL